jgi:catechol 2,3-dioxygenase-like lactoylglutathione lyase family enzyme
MCESDPEIRNLVESAGLSGNPDSRRMAAVRQRLAQTPLAPRRTHRLRTAGIAGLIVVAGAGAVIGGTQTGRDFVRHLFFPVSTSYQVTVPTQDGVMSYGRDNVPFTPEEQQEARSSLLDVKQQMETGGGELIGITEHRDPAGPGLSYTYLVRYDFGNGNQSTIGQGKLPTRPEELQRAQEIIAQYEAGLGEVVSHTKHGMGMGTYTLRFVLSDGQTTEVETQFPPGPRADREAVFAETAAYLQSGRFTVNNASLESGDQVWGLVTFRLADGRTVGLVEHIPAKFISPDGKHVVLPDADDSLEIDGATPDPS